MNEINCIDAKHKLSPIAWHHIKRDTTIPIVMCRDCSRILTGTELLHLDIAMIIESDGKDSYLK